MFVRYRSRCRLAGGCGWARVADAGAPGKTQQHPQPRDLLRIAKTVWRSALLKAAVHELG
ncbi:hypothetical protein XarbCFBP7408_07935 [Xanthomonas arboricola pv. guizotiae]|uniref:Uncharacterized protein n=1 Tax=Xanthomonas arboricola pv. guizotiae TaxID=487867 RepID=A0A2S6ZWW7_9XANT|nr:hypothetical protein XarbCFBP7409_14510 [Xanthomonas arboricola pv. guizotiae]PPU24637.1 hypothetical protein XarbCFBP7408_07935 [Xanthomonas arboricola pv. guizotiae]